MMKCLMIFPLILEAMMQDQPLTLAQQQAEMEQIAANPSLPPERRGRAKLLAQVFERRAKAQAAK